MPTHSQSFEPEPRHRRQDPFTGDAVLRACVGSHDVGDATAPLFTLCGNWKRQRLTLDSRFLSLGRPFPIRPRAPRNQERELS